MRKLRNAVLRKWNRASLRTKLISAPAVTIFIILLINAALYININLMMGRVNQIYISNVTLNRLSIALDSVQDSMKEYLDTKSSEALSSYYEGEQNFNDLVSGLNTETVDNEMLLTEKNISNLSSNYLLTVDAAISAKRGRDVEKYTSAYEEASRKYDVICVYIYTLNSEQFQNNTQNYQVLASSLHYLEMINLLLLVSAGVIDMLLLFYLTSSITRPLQDLSDAATEVSKGNFDIEVADTDSHDEVGILSRTFNQMTDSIRTYIRQIRENMEKESEMKEHELLMEGHLKDAQLKYLQAQINPHFLFNTLNAGAQMAMMENADKTCLFIENMADFFRYNIKKMDEDTTIGEELKLVDSYIYILNVRFSGEIHYSRQVDEAFEMIHVPSMILQPLVENAVNYGIRGIEHEGIIEVSVQEKDGKVALSVWDNGNGMTQDRIQEVLEGTYHPDQSASRSNGIGIGNVKNRLQLYFHTEEVMTIVSEGPGMGTEVIIWIPLEEQITAKEQLPEQEQVPDQEQTTEEVQLPDEEPMADKDGVR